MALGFNSTQLAMASGGRYINKFTPLLEELRRWQAILEVPFKAHCAAVNLVNYVPAETITTGRS